MPFGSWAEHERYMKKIREREHKAAEESLRELKEALKRIDNPKKEEK
jgi:hypothetical protein